MSSDNNTLVKKQYETLKILKTDNHYYQKNYKNDQISNDQRMKLYTQGDENLIQNYNY